MVQQQAPITAKTARLEARLTTEQKLLFERAARVAGRSVTDFVLTSAAAEARRLLLHNEVLELSAADSLAFAEAILNPVLPSAQLREADLWEWARARIPKFATPRYVEFRKELPRNATGRVLKFQLREEGVTQATWDSQK